MGGKNEWKTEELDSITTFRVKIFNIGLHRLMSPCSPYVVLDFDNGFDKLKTETASKGIDAKFNAKAAFMYRTKFGHKLGNKFLEINFYSDLVMFSDKRVGSNKIDLHTLATGPMKQDWVLRDEEGKPQGHAYFEIEMEEISEMTISLSAVKATLPCTDSEVFPKQCSPFVSFFYSRIANLTINSSSIETLVPQGAQVEWSDLPNLSIQCSMKELFRECVVINIYHDPDPGKSKKKKWNRGDLSKQNPIAQAIVGLRDVFLPGKQSHRSEFNVDLKPINAVATNEAQISGTIVFQNAPCLAQMVGGVMTADGLVQNPTDVDKYKAFFDVKTLRAAEKLFDTAPVPDVVASDLSCLLNTAEQKRAMSYPAVHHAGFTETKHDTMSMEDMQAEILRLHQEHETKLANLHLNFDGQKQKQARRVQQRLEERKRNLEKQRQLEESQTLLIQSPRPGSTQASVGGKVDSIKKDKDKAALYGRFAPPPARTKASIGNFEEPLPHGWEKRYDASGKVTYCYLNEKYTLDDPRTCPPEWEMRIDDNGRLYFANHVVCMTTYEDPRGCPPDWSMRIDPQTNRQYFANSKVKKTTFVDPRGLPPGYSMRLSEDSIPYFANDNTRTTQWEDPRTLPGVTPNMVQLWRSLEFATFMQTQKEKKLEKLQRQLQIYQDQVLDEFNLWLAEQEAILDTTQVNLTEQEVQSIRTNFELERQKLELELLKLKEQILGL